MVLANCFASVKPSRLFFCTIQVNKYRALFPRVFFAAFALPGLQPSKKETVNIYEETDRERPPMPDFLRLYPCFYPAPLLLIWPIFIRDVSDTKRATNLQRLKAKHPTEPPAGKPRLKHIPLMMVAIIHPPTYIIACGLLN